MSQIPQIGNQGHSSTVQSTPEKQKTHVQHKNLAASITLIVMGVLLIVASVVALLLMPHLGVVMTPLMALFAVPVLVGLVKVALAVLLLHKPIKPEIEDELQILDKSIIEVTTAGEEGKPFRQIPLSALVKHVEHKVRDQIMKDVDPISQSNSEHEKRITVLEHQMSGLALKDSQVPEVKTPVPSRSHSESDLTGLINQAAQE